MGALLSVQGGRDHRLIEGSLAGDVDAFGALYAAYFDRLVRYCRRRVRDRFLAEEIAQETFTRALARLGDLRDEDRFYPWLASIANRLVVDHHRRTWRVSPVAFVDPGTAAPADAPVIARFETQTLRTALGRVGARHREILRLRDGEGLSYQEIAGVLGTSTSTVAPLLHRARLALRREYLAVAGSERIAGLAPWLAGPLALLRRWRDRLHRAVAWLPDANAWCAPAACLVIVASGVLLPDNEQVRAPQIAAPTALYAEDPFGRQASREAGTSTYQSESLAGIAPAATPPATVVGGVQVSADARRSRWTRDRMREMPIYQEFGDMAIGADPDAMERDLLSTARGDLSWTRGECGQTAQRC